MPNDRYSGVMGRVLIVLALGFLAGLVIPAACHGQDSEARRRGIEPRDLSATARDSATELRRDSPRNIAQNAANCKPDGTQFSPRQLAIPVAAVWGASVYALGVGNQWHHEYIGAALLLSHRRWVQWVGLGVMVDDAAQHLIQTRHPKYLSPLHQAYALTLYRWFR